MELKYSKNDNSGMSINTIHSISTSNSKLKPLNNMCFAVDSAFLHQQVNVKSLLLCSDDQFRSGAGSELSAYSSISNGNGSSVQGIYFLSGNSSSSPGRQVTYVTTFCISCWFFGGWGEDEEEGLGHTELGKSKSLSLLYVFIIGLCTA